MTKKTNLGRRRAAAAVQRNPNYREKQKQIIEAAARVFQLRGYENTTLGHIADELKTDRANLYYYAASKQELFDQVLQQASENNLAIVETIANGEGTASAKLTAALTRLMETYNSDYPYLHLFMQRYLQTGPDLHDGMTRQTRTWSARYYNAIRAIISQGLESGEFSFSLPVGIVTISVIGTVNWIQAIGATNTKGRAAGKADTLDPGRIGVGLSEVLLQGLLKR